MRLSFDTWGGGEGGGVRSPPPLVLLHSILEDRRTWRNIGPDIARDTGRKVYAVDFRNHGLSPSSSGDQYDPWVLLSDLEEFLEQQHIQHSAMLGHSLGGVAAAMLALTKPHLVEKLILEETPPLGEDHSPSPALLRAANESVGALFDTLPPATDHESALRDLVDVIKPLLPMFGIPSSLADTYDPYLLPFKWDGTTLGLSLNRDALVRAIARRGALVVHIEGGKRYEGEVLAINGQGSRYTRNSASFVSSRFPRGRHVSVEGAGHFVHHQFPEEFTREVVCFLNRPPPSTL